MQPLIVLSILGVAAIGLGSGFLMPGVTNFTLQGVSVNEENFEAPVENAAVDIHISKKSTLLSTQDEQSGKTIFVNLIDECSFHTPDIGMGAGSTVICKLTDFDGDVVAEGKKYFSNGIGPSERVTVEIDQTAFKYSNEVQNINDIKIVLLGTNPTKNQLPVFPPPPP